MTIECPAQACIELEVIRLKRPERPSRAQEILSRLACGKECAPTIAEQKRGDKTLDRIVGRLRRKGFEIGSREAFRVRPGARVMRFRRYWMPPSQNNLSHAFTFLTARGWLPFAAWLEDDAELSRRAHYRAGGGRGEKRSGW